MGKNNTSGAAWRRYVKEWRETWPTMHKHTQKCGKYDYFFYQLQLW